MDSPCFRYSPARDDGRRCLRSALDTLPLGRLQETKLNLDFHVSDVTAGWRIPWYVLSDCVLLTSVLLRDLFTSRRAVSLYRVSGFKTSKDDPRMVARRVLATVYTTASPNSIVIGIDPKQSRLLFHQLERSAVSEMTRKLGANS